MNKLYDLVGWVRIYRICFILAILAAPTYTYGLSYTFETIHISAYPTYDSSINNIGEIVWTGSTAASLNDQIYSNVRGQITDGTGRNIFPDINDNGHIVWQNRISPNSSDDWEIVLDGAFVTSNNNPDTAPAMNNNGEIVWESSGIKSNINGVVYSGAAASPDINNLGEIVFRTDDGEIVSTIQGVLGTGGAPEVIDSGEVFWFSDWTIYSSLQGALTTATVSSEFAVNNNGDIIYQGCCGDAQAYILRNGIVTQIEGDYTEAWGMDINDNGVASFTGKVSDGTYGVFTTTIVPIPNAAWLFSYGLLGIVGVARGRLNA